MTKTPEPTPLPPSLHPGRDPLMGGTGKTVTSYYTVALMQEMERERAERLLLDINTSQGSLLEARLATGAGECATLTIAAKALKAKGEPPVSLPSVTIPKGQ